MTLRYSTALTIARADQFGSLLNAGAGAAYFTIYTGTQPATANSTATGTPLVSCTMSTTSMGGATDQTTFARAVANAIAPGTISATGTAGWVRFFDSDNSPILDGHVTVTAGDGIIRLDTLSLVINKALQIDTLYYDEPKE